MNITEVEDLAMYCRVCLQLPAESELLDLNLIYDEDEQLTYYDCFTMCTQIQISDGEDLPQNLCRSCGLELQMAYDFYKKVDESKRFLIQLKNQQGKSLMPALEAENEEETEEVEEEEEEEEEVDDATTAVEHEQEVIVEQEQVEMMEEEEVEEEEEEDDGDVENIEEHLEMEEYQTVEHLDDEDVETIQIKINPKSDGEEYIIEAITLDNDDDDDDDNEEDDKANDADIDGNCTNDDDMERKEIKLKERITWEEAVVAVANEQHLPVKTTTDTANRDLDYKTEPSAQAKFVYEVLEFDNGASLTTEEASDNPLKLEQTDFATEENTEKVTKKAQRYSGRFSCDICEKSFPNHSRMMLHRNSHSTNRPKFPCPHCDRLYATKQAMDVHVRTVHLKNGFICPICSKLYVIKKSLEVHLRYHTGDFPYVCDLCGKKFAQIGHLNTHRNVKHNSVRFSCEFPNCGKFFTSSTSLRNHEFTHTEMPFQCSFCEKGYPSKSKLKVHIRRKHDMELTLEQLEPMRKYKTSRSKLSLVKVVECMDYKCDEALIKQEIIEVVEEGIPSVDDPDLFKIYQEMDRIHSLKKEPNQENTKPTSPTLGNEKLSESENEDVDEEFTFEDLYEKVFEDIRNEHIEQQADGQENTTKTQPTKRRRRGRPRQKSYFDDTDDPDASLDEIVEACNRQNETTLKIPKNTIADADDLQSPNDNLVAETSEVLVSQTVAKSEVVATQKKRRGPTIKTEYTGPSYECEICQAVCKSRSLLNSHRFRKHRAKNNAKFSCPKCQRKFVTQDALEKHKRRPTCESYPQFECEHCGKKCIGLSNYNIHLRFHKRQYPFVCHLCGKKFMMCVHLNEHVLVKHENKRYPCEHPGCGKLFQTRNSLYNHTYHHSGFMPFECEYCKRGYASKSRLRYHCKKSHNIDHTIEELDRMQVTEKLPNPVVKPQ